MASTCSPPSGIPRRRERVSDIRFRKQRLLTVWITPLLRKLSEVGLYENSIEWFRYYITDRKHAHIVGTSCLTSCQSPTGFLREVFWAPCYLSSTSTICQASLATVKRHSMQTTRYLLLWVVLPGVDWLAQSRPPSGGKMAKRTLVNTESG